uniref:Uncharacterized protein n=1 Tax=Moniliophthora roreri TaxID=221103 RepID=A0A0W0GFN7_MONRR
MGSAGESAATGDWFGGESQDEAPSVIDIGTGISVPVSSSSESVDEAEGEGIRVDQHLSGICRREHGQMGVIWKGAQYRDRTREAQLIITSVHHLICDFKAAAFNDALEKLALGPEEKEAFDAGFQSVVLISGRSNLVVILFGIKEVEKLVGVGVEAVRVGDVLSISSFS